MTDQFDPKEAARELGRRGGLKGGKARAEKLTPEERSAIARRAVEARWAKAKGEGPESVRAPRADLMNTPPIQCRQERTTTMADHIPLITGKDGIALVNNLFADSGFVRVGLNRAPEFIPLIDCESHIWIDPCVDGMDNMETREDNSWYEFIQEFKFYEKIGSPEYHLSPKKAEVSVFVDQILDKCASHSPAWITVPQLPAVDNAGRNKINRMLAEAAGQWKAKSNFGGDVILPLILRHQRQSLNKTARNPKVTAAARCFEDSGAGGLWVVDKSLKDESAASTLGIQRFPGIIHLHEELNQAIPGGVKIAGPYWGLNLVLWAKGLVQYPLIGIGSGYQFFMSGGHATSPSAKVALPPLRRRVRVRPQLKNWLDSVIATLAPGSQERAELREIRDNFTILSEIGQAKEQVAAFYKKWCDEIAASPPESRAATLLGHFTAAALFGSKLPELDSEREARRPEAVAKSFMLSCV